jgi:hypothetical protein
VYTEQATAVSPSTFSRPPPSRSRLTSARRPRPAPHVRELSPIPTPADRVAPIFHLCDRLLRIKLAATGLASPLILVSAARWPSASIRHWLLCRTLVPRRIVPDLQAIGEPAAPIFSPNLRFHRAIVDALWLRLVTTQLVRILLFGEAIVTSSVKLCDSCALRRSVKLSVAPPHVQPNHC